MQDTSLVHLIVVNPESMRGGGSYLPKEERYSFEGYLNE